MYGITFGGGQFVACGANGTIWTSSDGIAWAARLTPNSTVQLNGVAFGAGSFVVCGASGTIWTSSDGAMWAARAVPSTSPNIFGITSANGLFVVCGLNGTIWSSPTSTTSFTLPTVANQNTPAGGVLSPYMRVA